MNQQQNRIAKPVPKISTHLATIAHNKRRNDIYMISELNLCVVIIQFPSTCLTVCLLPTLIRSLALSKCPGSDTFCRVSIDLLLLLLPLCSRLLWFTFKGMFDNNFRGYIIWQSVVCQWRERGNRCTGNRQTGTRSQFNSICNWINALTRWRRRVRPRRECQTRAIAGPRPL